MQEFPRTWRQLLRTIIKDPNEKKRLAQALDINAFTLIRWVNDETDPRAQNLHQLLAALPQHRSVLLELIRQEFEHFTDEAGRKDADVLPEIPASFFARVFREYSTLNEAQQFWSLGNLILQQAIEQLDPEQLGMVCVLAQCLPPLEGDKISALHTTLRLGTPPWVGQALHQNILLGSESTAGYVVSVTRQAVTIQNLEEYEGLVPVSLVSEAKSLSAHPLRRAGRIAGCLSVASSQLRLFTSSRVALIQQFAALLALILREEEFYQPEQIELVMMPSPQVQQPYMLSFQQRLVQVMREKALQGQILSYMQAELVVWHQLQEELRQLALASEA